VSDLSDRSKLAASAKAAASAGDWTDLEEGFFAAAPPDVAVLPPPPTSFDDLLPIDPRRRSHLATRTRGSKQTKTKPPARHLTSLLIFFRRFAQKAWSVAQPASVRAWRWMLTRGSEGARRLGPTLTTTRERTTHALRVLVSRLAQDLPERPDGKTILAAMAALIVVLGLSASVLGSRLTHPLALPIAAPEPTIVAPASAPAEAPALEPTPTPDPAATPRAAVVSPKIRSLAKRHGARRHGTATAALKPVFAR
jgi:hypothetical protein